MRKKINTFFGRKITIAKWQFNLFGLACFSFGTIWGIYLMMSGSFPEIFAAGVPASITKTATDTEFNSGIFSSTKLVSDENGARVTLGNGGTWSTLTNVPFAYNNIGDAVTDNIGHIFVMDGDSYQPTTRLWRYDIAASTWTQLSSSPESSDFTSMTYDGDGHIFVLRNRSMNPYPQWTNTIWKYDIATDTWSYLPGLPNTVGAGTVVSDKSGNLFVHLGERGAFFKYALSQGDSGSWVQLTNTPESTYVQSAAYDNNGHIFYLRGSVGPGYGPTDVLWRYDIASDTWSIMANAPGAVDDYSSSLEYDQNGNMYTTGNATGVLWKYDIALNSWSVLPNSPGSTSAVVYDNVSNSIYTLGIWGESTFFKFDAVDPTSGSFETQPMQISWNAGWADADSFSANVNLLTGTTVSFSIKAAISEEELAATPYVALSDGVFNSGVFTANLNDPDGDSNTPDGIAVGNNKYVKLKVEFNTDDALNTPELSSVTLNYTKDLTPPADIEQSTMSMFYKRWKHENAESEQIVDVQDGGWVSKSIHYNGDQYYYLNWQNAQDPDGGQVVGYCLNLSHEAGTSPAFDGGSGGLLEDSNLTDSSNSYYKWWGLPDALIDNTTVLDENGNPKCHFILKKQDLAGDRTEFNIKDWVFGYGAPWWLPSSDVPYYLNVKALDAGGNLSANTSTFAFKVDVDDPNRPAYFSGPGNFVSNKGDATISWPINNDQAANDLAELTDVNGNQTLDENGNAVKTEVSGVVGYQYCIGNDCWDSPRWFGLKHTGEMDDLIPFDQGSYTMQSEFLDANGDSILVKDANGDLVLDENGNAQVDSDFRVLNEGINKVWLRVCDRAGNCTNEGDERMRTDIKINTNAPSAPRSLTANPNDSKTNSYAFSWSEPERFFGDVKNIRYCYTVNKFPSKNDCTFTSAGTLSLVADAFATQPGENIFYLVAKGEGGEINYADYANVTFIYDGAPPTEPVNVDVSDISVKSKSDWKLIVSWSAPEDKGAGVSSYRIFRSTTQATCAENPSAFEEVGSTAGTSFADVGLEQKKYYYCVKAYDSANGSLNRYSNTVGLLPDGKFTEAAELTDGPTISTITTSRATITWSTGRDSDSKIAYGKKSGDYYAEEPSNSDQVTVHHIELNNLSPGTTYFFKAKWTDGDGNTGVSSEKSFKTEPAPTVKDVKAEDVGINSAFIKFTTEGSSKVKIYYGQSAAFGFVKEISTSTKESDYNFMLDGLSDNTKYYYKINTFDAEDQEYEGTTLDFTTLPRPRISEVQIQQIKDSAQPGIQVTWKSNTEISSVVAYAPVNNPTDRRTEVQVDLVSGSHEATIMDLKPLTTYELVVKGVDRSGNEAASESYTFTTASDTRPPQISEIVIEGSSTKNEADKLSQLTVSWNTDESATSQVEFGEGVGSSYTQRTQEDSNLANDHLVILSGLTPSKVYHLRIISKDQNGNTSYSQDTVSITPKAIDSAFELVVGNLMDVFGFLRSIGN